MDQYFNECLAATVQKISLPLELSGFLLAFIELKTPNLARKIEEFLEEIPTYLDNAIDFFGEFLFGTIGENKFIQYSLYILGFVLFVAMVASFTGALFIFSFSEFWEPIIFLLKVIAIGGSISLALLFLLAFISRILDFLDDFSHGKALGAFGLLLALTGSLGEIYQIIVLIMNTPTCI
ncbi:MAG: hypothetical protein RIC06_22465 [Cyclobacteriaceae bacterium]